jgi:hypothetical protein
VCQGNVCGGTTPACLPNGAQCDSDAACCSQSCSGGFCGGSVVACAVSSNANACDVCLADSCCPQLSACQANTVCEESQQCFDSCYSGPGSGAKCASKCIGEYPSSLGTSLEQCAATSCASACE